MKEWLRRARKDKNLNQFEMAESAKIAVSYYNMIENGSRRPSVEVAKRIADVLDFDWRRFYEKSEKGA